MIELQHVTKSFGDKTVLNDVSLTVYDGEKVGIIGDNGQGKTTLIKMIVGQLEPDQGIVKTSDTIGYLPQSIDIDFNQLITALEDVTFANNFFKYSNILRIKRNIFAEGGLENLSGGEKTKIALAFAFASEPSVMILDEPTNHIDLAAIKDVIKAINAFDGTVLTVSHDVDFLNAVVNKIIKVKDGEIKEYFGNYDDYAIQNENERLNNQREYDAQTRRIEKLKNDIHRYKTWADEADRSVGQQGGNPSDARLAGVKGRAINSAAKLSGIVKSKESALEKELENRVQRPEGDIQIKYRLQKDDLRSKTAFSMQNVGKSFRDNVLFKDVNLVVESGEKVALVGDNGCGKTTFIKLLTGEEKPTSGIIRLTPSLKIGLMSQDVYDLPGDMTIFEMSQYYDREYRPIFLSNLVNMNIDKSRFDTKIKKLSSGEQMRIKLSELILSDANMLILDEPTNHLDISNKEFLKKVLAGYVGTMMVVSHDKKFLEGIVDTVLEFKNQAIKKKDLNESLQR
ncbi:MAG: ABC-F family ATP-binding cassette domain-containing protein [Clostridia bacterium]|nr:ABC-F family ATP-binding cassette domain-containing protein [Clostridia bacterium]